METKPSLIESVCNGLDQKGIQNYVVILENPDKPGETWSIKGSISWCVGAMTVVRHELLNGYGEEGHE